MATSASGSVRSLIRTLACAGALLAASLAQAATFRTFLNDPAGMAAAIGPGSIRAHESFASAVDGQLLTATPDVWNSFTLELIGTGTAPGAPSLGASHYCQSLAAAHCINWNANTPAVPGVYAIVDGPATGISLKFSSPTIAGFSFEFTDWNDPVSAGPPPALMERSYFQVLASDGTAVDVHGVPQQQDAPPQTFGVALSAADIAAGIYLKEIRWVGITGTGEVVGFYHFQTYTNPVLASSLSAVPVLEPWALVLLSTSLAGSFLWTRHRRGARLS